MTVEKVEPTEKKRRRYSLEELLVGLTKEPEVEWGAPVGKEICDDSLPP